MPTTRPAVTFDVGQTLLELDAAYLAARLASQGVVVTVAVIDAASAGAWASYEAEIRAGGEHHPWKLLMERWLAGAGVGAGAGPGRHALVEWLWQAQPTHNLWRRPVPGMIDVVDALRGRGVVVGVVSNSEGHVAELLAEVGWGDRFAAVADSGRLGVAKPDPGIFAWAAAALGADPARSIHVGDSDAADVAGARAAGWSALWFGPQAAATRAAGAPARPGVLVAADADEVAAALATWPAA